MVIVAGITFDGDCEVAWDTEIGGVTYHVHRAPTSGGVYVEIATVSAPTTYYVDTAYSSGNCYKVATDGGSLSGVITPTPCHDSVANPDRHDVITDGGSTIHLSTWENLHYSQVAYRNVVSGPISYVGLFDDQFAAGAPLETLVSGTVAACGGGSCTLTATGSNWAVLKGTASAVAPVFGVVVDITSCTEDVLVGYGLDATHGVFARYDNSAETIDIFGVNGGGSTSFFAAASHTLNGGTFKLALEFCNLVFNCWKDVGSGWVHVGSGFAVIDGTYDFRQSSRLSAWAPLLAVGNGSGSTTTVMSRFRCSIWSGNGGLREMAPVTAPDGRPALIDNSYYLLAADRQGPIPVAMGNTVSGVAFSVQRYDPDTASLTDGAVATISLEASNGRLLSGQDGKVIYDADAGGFHLFNNDWSNTNTDAFPSMPELYYQFWPGDTLSGFVHMDSPTLVSLPGSIDLYGVDAIKIGSTWYVVGTSTINPWNTSVVSGSSPTVLTTLVVTDNSRDAEGYTWFPHGSRLYLIAGSINDTDGGGHWGQIFVWDFSDLTNLIFCGHLDYPNPMSTGANLPQQPTIFWNGNVPQLIGFDDSYFTRYADAGPMQVCEPSYLLSVPQFTPISTATGFGSIFGGIVQ